VVYAPSNASLSEIQLTSSSLKLHHQISNHLSSSAKLGSIKSPTAIQSIAWPLLSDQSSSTTRDVIVQSETGSGKTLAYLVPIIQDLLTLANNHSEIVWSREIGTLAIILVPTRELAEQVYHVAIDLLSFPQKSGPSSNDTKTQDQDDNPDQPEIPSDGLNPRWLVPGTLHGVSLISSFYISRPFIHLTHLELPGNLGALSRGPTELTKKPD
jgi:ATP-dependent RNA helicase DDX31/DBP7